MPPYILKPLAAITTHNVIEKSKFRHDDHEKSNGFAETNGHLFQRNRKNDKS